MGFLCCTLPFHLLLKMLRRCEKWGNRSKLKKDFFILFADRGSGCSGNRDGGDEKNPTIPLFPIRGKLKPRYGRDPTAPPPPPPKKKKKKKEKGKNGNVVPVRHRIPLQMKPKELLLLLSLILAVCGKRIVGQREINPLPQGNRDALCALSDGSMGEKKGENLGKRRRLKSFSPVFECRVRYINMGKESPSKFTMFALSYNAKSCSFFGSDANNLFFWL